MLGKSKAAVKGIGDTVAYCGLFCEICVHAEKGCKGCRNAGGAKDCHQRKCCIEKGIDGCWQCGSFPCDKGFFADEAWKGLCIGFVRCIMNDGIDSFVGLAASKLGKVFDYGGLRFKRDEEVLRLLHDEG